MRNLLKHLFYLVAGIYLGVVFIKTEVISWFRIQEMFRFESFHMYGVILSAVIVGAISVQLIRRFALSDRTGAPIDLTGKTLSKGTVIGSLCFGFGWALTGACPGPLYTLIGGGVPIMAVAFLSAMLGAYIYGLLQSRLPH
ncbi:MAG: YeeE/YedE family protein [bacterium]|nr:YeeE/YedE family protein [bacterium]